MGVYVSWTGCIPQKPWEPSSAFLIWLSTAFDGDEQKNSTRSSGWHMKENRFTITPVTPDPTCPSKARRVKKTPSSGPRSKRQKFGAMDIDKKKKKASRKRTFSEQMYLDLMAELAVKV